MHELSDRNLEQVAGGKPGGNGGGGRNGPHAAHRTPAHWTGDARHAPGPRERLSSGRRNPHDTRAV
jgi:hypothetical protein